jgi:nucleoid-associated protein YgaU
MNRQHPARRDPSRSHLTCACSLALVCASVLLTPSATKAQDTQETDVAEAARQAKARKAAQAQKPAPHVYTNDDLQRSQILTPEDRAPIEAGKKNSVPPVINAPLPSNATADGSAPTESLGEIARRVRQEKSANQAEQAGKLPAPPPYHLESSQAQVFAHPKSVGRPLAAPSSPSHKIVQPPVSAEPHKRDPFSRATISPAPSRSLPAPVVAPVIPRTEVHAPPIVAKTQPDTSHVRIEPGDSLWSLSRQYLGRGERWHVWLESNPTISDPRRLQPGMMLVVPRTSASSHPRVGNNVAAASAISPIPRGQPSDTVAVQPGDSLWKLAAQHFGHGADWPCLASANPDLLNPSLIYPGQILHLTETCAAVSSYLGSDRPLVNH